MRSGPRERDRAKAASDRSRKVAIVSAVGLSAFLLMLVTGAVVSGEGEGDRPGAMAGGAGPGAQPAEGPTAEPPVGEAQAATELANGEVEPFSTDASFSLVESWRPPPPDPVPAPAATPPSPVSPGPVAGRSGGDRGSTSGHGFGRDHGPGRGSGPGQPLGTGDISFRMYWTPPSNDIDLHVICPRGHHISYRSTRCPCGGTLDRDDRTSGGPENVFWPDGRGPAGTYIYYAHYYSGAGAREVAIEVRRGTQVVRTHRAVLAGMGAETERFRYALP